MNIMIGNNNPKQLYIRQISHSRKHQNSKSERNSIQLTEKPKRNPRAHDREMQLKQKGGRRITRATADKRPQRRARVWKIRSCHNAEPFTSSHHPVLLRSARQAGEDTVKRPILRGRQSPAIGGSPRRSRQRGREREDGQRRKEKERITKAFKIYIYIF